MYLIWFIYVWLGNLSWFLLCLWKGIMVIGGVRHRQWFLCLLSCTGWKQELFLCTLKLRKCLGVCLLLLSLFCFFTIMGFYLFILFSFFFPPPSGCVCKCIHLDYVTWAMCIIFHNFPCDRSGKNCSNPFPVCPMIWS